MVVGQSDGEGLDVGLLGRRADRGQQDNDAQDTDTPRPPPPIAHEGTSPPCPGQRYFFIFAASSLSFSTSACFFTASCFSLSISFSFHWDFVAIFCPG